MAIFIPRKKEFWQRKPTDNVELLDSYSPIVVAAPENNIFNYATNTNGINTGVTIDGNVFKLNSSSTDNISFNGIEQVTTGYSFIAISNGISTNAVYSTVFNLGARVQLRHDANNYTFYHNDGAWKSTNFTGGYRDNSRIILVGVFDGTAIHLYNNGHSVASTAVGTLSTYSTNIFNLGSNISPAGVTWSGTGFDGDIEFVAIVKDVFPPEKAKELSLAPYQILKPRKKYFSLGSLIVVPSRTSTLGTVGKLPSIRLGSTVTVSNNTPSLSVGNIATTTLGNVFTTTVYSSVVQSGIPTSNLGAILAATNTALQVQSGIPAYNLGAILAATNTALQVQSGIPTSTLGSILAATKTTLQVQANTPSNHQGMIAVIPPLHFSVQAAGNIPSILLGARVLPTIRSIRTASNMPSLLTGIVFREYISFKAYIHTSSSSLVTL